MERENARIPAAAEAVPADVSVPEQQKQQNRPRGRPFAKGRSGNPAGRPPGPRNRAQRVAAALFDGEAAALARTAIARALAGDTAALRLCLDRLLPPRRARPVALAMPPIRGPADIAGAMEAVMAGIRRGAITPGEAGELGRMVAVLLHAIEVRDFEDRLSSLEAAQAESGSRSAFPYGGY